MYCIGLILLRVMFSVLESLTLWPTRYLSIMRAIVSKKFGAFGRRAIHLFSRVPELAQNIFFL